MADTAIIEKINTVIEEFWAKNPSITIVPVKELMPDFINSGIFTKDIRKGLPIRKILNELDDTNELSLIPFVYAERNEQNTYWYFIPLNADKPTSPYKQSVSEDKSKESNPSRFKNDEGYIIDLCDKVIGKRALRQKKFSFLEGDIHKNGKTKTKLPVDAYYEELQLVVEYRKEHKSNPDSDTNKRSKITVSGVTREEQRIRYNSRVEKTLDAHNIKVICIHNSSFACDDKNNIIRNEKNDMKIVQKALNGYENKLENN